MDGLHKWIKVTEKWEEKLTGKLQVKAGYLACLKLVKWIMLKRQKHK